MPKKATSLKVARIASKLLRNPKSSTNVKKVSASDLSQREKGGKKRQQVNLSKRNWLITHLMGRENQYAIIQDYNL